MAGGLHLCRLWNNSGSNSAMVGTPAATVLSHRMHTLPFRATKVACNARKSSKAPGASPAAPATEAAAPAAKKGKGHTAPGTPGSGSGATTITAPPPTSTTPGMPCAQLFATHLAQLPGGHGVEHSTRLHRHPGWSQMFDAAADGMMMTVLQ
jgi:hypothetical protein